MKGKYFLSLMLACSVSAAYAQQVPNGGFDYWEDCYPWESGKKISTARGSQPVGWCTANVNGVNGMGATIISSEGTDYNGKASSKSVVVTNTPNPWKASQIVPGYFSIGTAWATAKAGLSVTDADGGVFGGMAFSCQPDAIRFVYKRSYNVDGASKNTNLTERASVIAYTWKGTWTQAEVPSNTTMGNPTKVTMTDRSNNVLGKSCLTGGTISKTADAELLSVIEYYIEGAQGEWKELVIPFEYKNKNAKPEKLNIIFSANDMFADRKAMGTGNRLEIDDVELLYYSELASAEFDGNPITFREGSATVVGMYDETKMKIVSNGVGATIEQDYSDDTMTLTVTVKGADIAVNPSNNHTYKVTFTVPTGIDDIQETEIDSPSYNLSGQRVSTAKGIIVKGGKKYLVK